MSVGFTAEGVKQTGNIFDFWERFNARNNRTNSCVCHVQQNKNNNKNTVIKQFANNTKCNTFFNKTTFIQRPVCLKSYLSTIKGKLKVKRTLVQTLRLCTGRTAHRGSRGIALPFLDHGNRRGEGSASRPGRALLPEKTRYSLYRMLDGPQGRSGQVRNISSPPGFDPRTVQPLACRYTDYATRPT